MVQLLSDDNLFRVYLRASFLRRRHRTNKTAAMPPEIELLHEAAPRYIKALKRARTKAAKQ